MAKDNFTREEVVELLEKIHDRISTERLKPYNYEEQGLEDKKWWLFIYSPQAHKLSHEELLNTFTNKITIK